ncbi:MAG: 2-amino-4-hydroxy-6-hydroxymethyldihydropteridine diphosphokinase [Gammaproteobacteria bacterium]
MNLTTYIALGSNLNNPVAQLHAAIRTLSQLPNSALIRTSSFYQNPPFGPPQPDFINAVAELQTSLSAEDLLITLHKIEQQQGRIRTEERNGPRTLDLDIILYGNMIIQSADLTIPHPRLYARPFVLIPLYEITPNLVFPDGRELKDCIQEKDYRDLKRVYTQSV